MATPKFGPEDKVFAKVRGYPPWPAKVRGLADETPNKIKYHVYFYGTTETAVCKAEELFDYIEFRDKFGKPLKRKFFVEALNEIEQDLDPSVRRVSIVKDDNQTHEKDSDEEGSLIIDEEKSKGKIDGAKGTKRKYSSIANTSNGDANTPDASSKASSEVVSRSGRKIKPKKFSDDEGENSKNVDKDDSASDDTDEDGSTRSVNARTVNNEMAYCNGDSKPDLQKALQKKVEEIKNQEGFSTENLDALKVEVLLLDCDCRIKTSLSLTRANCDDCLQALDEILELKLTALMLKKHPEVVETVKKLRRYIGNVPQWNLTPEENEKFLEKANEIRRKSDFLYHKFKALFTVPEGSSFTEVYNAELEKFNLKTADYSVNEVYGLVVEPADDE